jgi:hypothetical protein
MLSSDSLSENEVHFFARYYDTINPRLITSTDLQREDSSLRRDIQDATFGNERALETRGHHIVAAFPITASARRDFLRDASQYRGRTVIDGRPSFNVLFRASMNATT